jgi:hypothetical protein
VNGDSLRKGKRHALVALTSRIAWNPVMAGHSRSKNGVLQNAYVPAIHVSLAEDLKDVDARHKAGHDG